MKKSVLSEIRIYLFFSIFSALIFLLLLPLKHPYPFSYILKILPLISLLILAVRNFKGKRRILLIMALLFCMAGDVLLDLDRSANFKPALVSFLIGHLFYIFLFLSGGLDLRSRLPMLLVTLVYSLTVGFILSSIDPEFLLPVFAYLTVISLMTLSAFSMKDFSWLIAAGASVFMFSDTIIAVNKFLQPIPYSTVFNISLYYAAQILIVLGLIIKSRPLATKTGKQ